MQHEDQCFGSRVPTLVNHRHFMECILEFGSDEFAVTAYLGFSGNMMNRCLSARIQTDVLNQISACCTRKSSSTR